MYTHSYPKATAAHTPPTHPITISILQGYRDAVLIDADLFFGMVFGAERFRPYLGKLFLASAMGKWVFCTYVCVCVLGHMWDR